MQTKIIEIIESNPGIKSVELVAKIATEIKDEIPNGKSISEILDELVENKSIIEVEYILPNINYRIKSIYFPKGTVILNALH